MKPTNKVSSRFLNRYRLSCVVGAAILAVLIPLISPQPTSAKPVVCPDSVQGIECDYYKDGYKAGRKDRKANMSMAYERHSDAYDSRFEENYRDG